MPRRICFIDILWTIQTFDCFYYMYYLPVGQGWYHLEWHGTQRMCGTWTENNILSSLNFHCSSLQSQVVLGLTSWSVLAVTLVWSCQLQYMSPLVLVLKIQNQSMWWNITLDSLKGSLSYPYLIQGVLNVIIRLLSLLSKDDSVALWHQVEQRTLARVK